MGALVAVAASYTVYAQLLPWYASIGGVVVGLYLALPRRMRTVGDSVTEIVKRVKESL